MVAPTGGSGPVLKVRTEVDETNGHRMERIPFCGATALSKRDTLNTVSEKTGSRTMEDRFDPKGLYTMRYMSVPKSLVAFYHTNERAS